jgi:hypothetical protein
MSFRSAGKEKTRLICSDGFVYFIYHNNIITSSECANDNDDVYKI